MASKIIKKKAFFFKRKPGPVFIYAISEPEYCLDTGHGIVRYSSFISGTANFFSRYREFK
jgi:hypothetical protein